MNIFDIYFSRLRNNEHFQFHTEFRDLVNLNTPVALGVVTQFDGYLLVYNNESEAFEFIRKNDLSDDLVDADDLRDFTFRGLDNNVKSDCNHYNPLVRQAAARVQVVFGHFGNIVRKSYDEETVAINTLISELNSTYAADVTTLGISGWLTELQANNTAFDTLMKSRYSAEAVKTQRRMKQARIELDAAYRIVVSRINALIIVNGEAAYKTFVDELNQRIARFSNNVAIRTGRNAKDDPPAPASN
jgi:hypothetical protein